MRVHNIFEADSSEPAFDAHIQQLAGNCDLVATVYNMPNAFH